jgi:hypothetical protein
MLRGHAAYDDKGRMAHYEEYGRDVKVTCKKYVAPNGWRFGGLPGAIRDTFDPR